MLRKRRGAARQDLAPPASASPPSPSSSWAPAPSPGARARCASAASASTPSTLAAPAAAKVPSLVVLPLSNFANEPEYFVDGMTDALISALARIQGVRVISRQSAMHYKDSKKLLPEIARELGVDFVVEGSVARLADRVRLNAQVVQADPETTLWSESFERAATDVLALQNTFASAIASAIHVQVSPVEQTRLATTKPVDPDVYEAFLQGKYYGGQFGEASVRKAKGYFERAIAKDPTFAPAWSGLSESLQWLAAFHADPAQLMPEAEAAARRAIELDGSLAEAHASLSGIFLNRWDFPAAETSINKAIELNPGSAAARRGHWLLLAYQLRLAEASAEIELAKQLDPLSAQVSADVGVQHLFEGRHEAAISELKNALELDPDYALSHVYLFLTYSEMKQDPERGLELRHYVSELGRPELIPEFSRRLADGTTTAPSTGSPTSSMRTRRRATRPASESSADCWRRPAKARRRSPGSNAASSSAPGIWRRSRSPRTTAASGPSRASLPC